MLLSSVRILTSWEAPWHDIQVDEQPNYQQAEPGADSSTEKFGREDPSSVRTGVYNSNDCGAPANVIIKPEVTQS